MDESRLRGDVKVAFLSSLCHFLMVHVISSACCCCLETLSLSLDDEDSSQRRSRYRKVEEKIKLEWRPSEHIGGTLYLITSSVLLTHGTEKSSGVR